MERRMVSGNSIRLASTIATVMPETRTVRPAVATVPAAASSPQPPGPGDVGGGLLVDCLVGGNYPADLAVQAGRGELGLDRVVAVLPGGVARTGQFDDGVGLMAAGAEIGRA